MKQDERLRERLHHELSMIRQMGYAAYFLTVAEIVADVKAMGIMAACRGSAAGSLVCYLTGISDVDALRHDLAFERFLNPMRDELPDVDIDVESARREDVYDMILSRHGQERAACVAMIDTFRARAAIREVGKALGLPEVEVGMVAKAFPHISARNIRDGLERLPELQRHQPADAPAGAAVPRRRAPRRVPAAHRAASVRHRACPATTSPSGCRSSAPPTVTGWSRRTRTTSRSWATSSSTSSGCGCSRRCAMRSTRSPAPPGRRSTWTGSRSMTVPPSSLIRASDTLGCFQIESPGQRELLQKLQPDAVGGPDRRHLAVPSGPGEIRHDPAVPLAPDDLGAAELHPPGASAGPPGDVRGDRVLTNK